MADALNDLDQALPASLFERQGYRSAVCRMRELELDRPTTAKHLPAWVEAVKGFVYEVEAVLEAGAILGQRAQGERVGLSHNL